MGYIQFEEFKKIDVRVGSVITAERLENTNKLMKLIVNIGQEERQIIAGIANNYTPEELIGKKLMVVVNLEPKIFKGLESRGMILAADWENEVAVIFVDDKVPVGTRVV
jgi:methionyl-tRNA synthetase